MAESKKNVAIIFGGKSAEHEVSIRSAGAIYKNIDRSLFSTSLIYINRDGRWSFIREENIGNPETDTAEKGSFLPWEKSGIISNDIDIYFPVLHGPNGEDGRIQGIFEMSGVPFAGAGSLSSNLAMDKVVSKILFEQAGLSITKYKVYIENDPDLIIEEVESSLGYPCFIKPCALGSSVGISKAENVRDLVKGINEAFKYDIKIIIEEAIAGMEYEVSVKGNDVPVASRAGSFIPSKDFYDYEDKYILGKTEFQIPAELPVDKEDELREAALTAYRALFLNGFSRVDFFVEEKTGRIIINEINTIPGFTEISMFPKLWTTEGLSFKSLITEIINLGFEHSEKIFSRLNKPE